ncbi:ABC transporter permease [Agromyces sp. NPDC060279]|uniref:ABC transporter permease n=1 Tax=Agromyces sp. NPDC060279 TaxID=3347092 RepID=UPI003665D921
MTTVVFEALRMRRRRTRTSRGFGVTGIVATAVVGLAVLAALLAPVIAPYDPNEVDFGLTYRPMEPWALLGTDGSGRDILSRLLYGARTSLLGPAVVVLVAAVVGTLLALVAAISGGWVDRILSRIFDIGFAFPGLLLAILAVSVLGPGFTTAVLALAIAYIPFIARIVRSVAVGEMSLPYLSALVTVGQSRTRIAGRHLLPAVMPTVLAQSTISFGYAMVDLAALSFLGLGVQPPDADWGLMISEGQRGVLQGYWEEATFAGLAIVIVVAAVSLIGDRLADRVSLNREGR